MIDSNASLVIASDSEADAALIKNLLEGEYSRIALCIYNEVTPRDALESCPDILILAFKKLESSENFYLGLFRQGIADQERRHRTVVLCTRDEVTRAYELCRQELFDDYVLFWPFTLDHKRLHMAVCQGLRQLSGVRLNSLRHPEVFVPSSPQAHSEPVPNPMSRDSECAHGEATQSRATVLVVEDDDAQRMLAVRMLQSGGYTSRQASGGREALQMLDQFQPDVILLDVQMTDMTGLDVLRNLRDSRSAKSIPVIMVTGHADQQTVRSSVELGVADYLIKPFDRSSLIGKVDRVLIRRSKVKTP